MGSTTREVVTLQIGHYSNFIGTHWWNLQVGFAAGYNGNTLSFNLEIWKHTSATFVWYVLCSIELFSAAD